MTRWMARGKVVADGEHPRVMAILNTTPDSFSDGGLAHDPEVAIARAIDLEAEGADILDIGGESSRPGADIVETVEEIRRVLPVIERLQGRLTIPISVDTTKAEVARLAIEAGATIVNDIRALGDPAMMAVVADSDVGVVLMHMQGDPRTMQNDPRYDDVVGEVFDWLADRIELAGRRGIARERIAIDPGIGFGKTFEHNMLLLRNLDRFARLGCVVLLGTSRKGFLGAITGRARADRATASAVSSLWGVRRAARVVRVHDVAPMIDALKIWAAVEPWGDPS